MGGRRGEGERAAGAHDKQVRYMKESTIPTQRLFPSVLCRLPSFPFFCVVLWGSRGAAAAGRRGKSAESPGSGERGRTGKAPAAAASVGLDGVRWGATVCGAKGRPRCMRTAAAAGRGAGPARDGPGGTTDTQRNGRRGKGTGGQERTVVERGAECGVSSG